MTARDTSPVVLWRCRECGKWSHAKRDPIAHKRWHQHGDAADEDGRLFEGQGWFVWCGPFDRWTAQYDDPSPRAVVHNLGDPVNRLEKEAALAPAVRYDGWDS